MSVTRPTLQQAVDGLIQNTGLIDPQRNPVEWNTNQALLVICQKLDGLRRDMELVQGMTEAVLKSVED